jgi:hypothetical protein
MKSYARTVPALLLLWPLGCGGSTPTQAGLTSPQAIPQTSADTAAQGELVWQEFLSAEGQFSVRMPGTPITQTRAAPNGTITWSHGLELKDGAFVVLHIDASTAHLRDFDTVVKELSDKFGGTLLTESEFTLGGATGKEFEMELSRPKEGFLSARVVAANGRLYQILALGSHARKSDPDVQKFLESFRLTN